MFHVKPLVTAVTLWISITKVQIFLEIRKYFNIINVNLC